MPIPKSAAPRWLHWLKSCESTNTWAIHHPAQLQHGDAVYTPQQTAGRGQQGRRWYAPPGGLTASLILDNLSARQLTGLSLVVGLAVIYAIEDLLPHLQGQLGLKWPNDVMAQSCKLAGILCEATSSGHATRVVIGIGLNYQVEFARTNLTAAEVGQPISLHQLCDNSALPDELMLLERLRHYLKQASTLIAQRGLQHSPQSSGIAAFLPALRQRDWLLDRQVGFQVNQSANLVAGQAAGLDNWGRLLIRQADGDLRAFASGRVVNWN
jgi:BirA family transcriptional regulator, biotin operon repressor / biotin---[acetyl-CoA-carboxylase] ligase